MAQYENETRVLSRPTQFIKALSDVLLSWVFWTAFLVAAGICFIIYTSVQNEDYLRLEAEFHEQVEETHSELLMEMKRYKGTLYEARSIYLALPSERKDQWSKYIKDLDVLEENPGHAGLAFIENVPGKHLPTFQVNHPSLKVTPKMQKRNCIISMYSMPEAYPKAMGYNLCATSTVEKALVEAAQTGKITASPPTYLYGNTNGTTAILLSLPIYYTDTVPDTEAERELQLAGWIGSLIQFETLLKNLVAEKNELEFQLFQGEAAPQNLLFNHLKDTDTTSTIDLFATRTLEIDDHLYTMLYVKRDIGSHVTYSIPLLLLSLLFSLLAGSLIWNLYTSKERAELLASKMSQSLTDTEVSMKKLLDASPGAIYTHRYEDDCTSLFVSGYFHHLTGYPPLDFKSRAQLDEIIYPQDLVAVKQEIAESLKEHGLYEVEYRVIKCDGTVIWVMDKGYLEKHDEGSIIRGVMFDITKTKRIEKTSHQLNNALIYMAEGTSLLDQKGTFVEINLAFARMCGWDMDRVPGVQFIDILHPDDVGEAEQLFQQLSRKEKISGELRGIHQDGTFFYMSLIFVGLYDGNHELAGAYLFARDISERKNLEENLHKAKEENRTA